MVEHIKLVNKKSKQGLFCGEGGIRTRGALLELTHFPGVRLRPLGHLSFTHSRNVLIQGAAKYRAI